MSQSNGWLGGVPEPRSNPEEGPVAKALELEPGNGKVACHGGMGRACRLPLITVM